MRSLTSFFLLFIMTNTAYAEQLNSATAKWSPYAMESEESTLNGIAVDIFNQIISRSGHTNESTLLPTKRLNALFDTNKIDINFADSPNWNPKRSNPQYVFSDPYMHVAEYIYFKEGSDLTVSQPSDLNGKIVGINFGYYYEDFTPFFKKESIRTYESHTANKLVSQLSSGRIDAIFLDEIAFKHLLNEENLSPISFKRGKQLSMAPLGLKIRIEKKHLRAKFNQVIAELKKDGRIKKIIDDYTIPNSPLGITP